MARNRRTTPWKILLSSLHKGITGHSRNKITGMEVTMTQSVCTTLLHSPSAPAPGMVSQTRFGYGNLSGDIPENATLVNRKIMQILLCVAALRLFINL
jgi:hypothetical protein